MHRTKQSLKSQGFTIVELLIVIVVIGILAAITLVAYNGVQQSASAVVLKSDLKQAQTQLELDRINDGEYPDSKEAADGGKGLRASPDTNLEYTKSGADYCLTASSDRAKTSFHFSSSDGTIQDGACGDHTGYVDGASIKTLTFDGNQSTGGSTATQLIAPNATAPLTTNGFTRNNYSFSGWNTAANGSGTNYANGANYTMGTSDASLYAQWMATTMQTLTPSNCSSLATFTGSNTEAIVELTDSRGGTTRTYQVAKLADGKCWMLNNLKLGSTTGTTTLTPADSNVATNFTLPQLVTSASVSFDTPKANGPVPGDTGSGATNYGYLYNWPAATAGQSRTTMPAGSGNAPNSICPANWRLPTGGTTPASSDFGTLDIAFGGAGAFVSRGPSLSSWQPSGSYRGVRAGFWDLYFSNQGSVGYVWSSSANPSSANNAFGAGFGVSFVNPGNVNNARSAGFGVRCLLN